MNETVRVMDVDLNILDNKSLEETVKEYLSNDKLNVILLASQKLLLQAAELPELQEMVLQADLVLPGEEELLSLHHGELLQEYGMIVNYYCLENLLKAFQGERKTIYIVSEKERHIRYVGQFLQWLQSDMVLAGSAVKPEATDEGIVNEINSLAPDVLLLDLEDFKQESWIGKYGSQLNAKLCIGLGGVMEQMIVEYKEEPPFISRLGLSGIYNVLVRRNFYKKAKEGWAFRKKLREYKGRGRK